MRRTFSVTVVTEIDFVGSPSDEVVQSHLERIVESLKAAAEGVAPASPPVCACRSAGARSSPPPEHWSGDRLARPAEAERWSEGRCVTTGRGRPPARAPSSWKKSSPPGGRVRLRRPSRRRATDRRRTATIRALWECFQFSPIAGERSALPTFVNSLDRFGVASIRVVPSPGARPRLRPRPRCGGTS